MVPDIDVIGGLLANEDANWVSITFRGIGEMENSPVVSTLDPARRLDRSQPRDGPVGNAARLRQPGRDPK
jgi:hypothetical protein